MKRLKDIYSKIYDMDNLYKAYLLSRRSKRYRAEVLYFTNNLPEELEKLHLELKNKTYKVGVYKQFKVYEPKERIIMSLPFRDRVVQHAINNIIEKHIIDRMIQTTYACVKGRGTHSASKKTREWIHSVDNDLYFLKCDIRKYFPSTDKDVLLSIVRRYIKCTDTLNLLKVIIESHIGTGIPIGNLTSQLMANLYLSELDKYVTQSLKFQRYIRYMDDFLVVGYSKSDLKNLLNDIEVFLKDILKLEINNKTRLAPVHFGINFVGYVHKYNDVKIRRCTLIKIKYNIKSDAVDSNVKRSIIGMLKHVSNRQMYDQYRKQISQP